MSEPERQHTTEPAEGGDPPGTAEDTGVRPEEPAEGEDLPEAGAETSGS